MIFSLETLRAKHGDALLLHYGPAASPRLMVIDGGPSGVFNTSLRPRLEELREERGEESLPIQLLMVSHIDDDHIRGVLDLTKRLRKQQDRAEPLDYDIRTLWHNSFDDIVGRRADVLETAAREGITPASTADDVPPEVVRNHPGALVLASVKQGRQLRLDADTLGLQVNRGDGGLIVARGGDEDEVSLGHGLKFRILGPLQEQVDRFQQKWDRELERLGLARPAAVEAAAFVDESVFNLASLVVLAEAEERTMLLTGDARGDHLLDGLHQAGLLEPGGTFHVDLLKVPHHGSDRNVTADFFRQVTADHYVISGDGKHGNPEVETFKMIFEAREGAPFTLHLTYAPEELKDDYPQDRLLELFEEQRDAGADFEIVTPEEGGRSLRIDLLDELG